MTIADGDFGSTLVGHSVLANATSGSAVVNITTGSFDAGVNASRNGRGRLSEGSYGPIAFSQPTVSVIAGSERSGTAVVDIFGGSFSHALQANQNGTINVYGSDLSITGERLTGILADGSLIDAKVDTSGGGQILLRRPIFEVDRIPAGFDLITSLGGASIDMPEFGPCSTIKFAGLPIHEITINDLVRDGGVADTIIRRTQPAEISEPGQAEDTIPIELIAMKLVSETPVPLQPFGGTGTDFLCLTARNGVGQNAALSVPQSSGEMIIDFEMRTFEMALDVIFDVHLGAPDGPILFSSQDFIRSAGPIPWLPDSPDGAIVVPGLNDGFFPTAVASATGGYTLAGSMIQLPVQTAPVPEPATWVLLLGGLVCDRLVKTKRQHVCFVRN